jgi:uncharacterized protein VirK/YbjX
MKELVGTLLRTAPLIHRQASPGGILKRAKYCIRGLALAPYTSDWFEFLQAPELSLIVKNHPSLFQKLQRPYLHRNLNTSERLAAVKQHYRFVLAHFSVPQIEEVYAPEGKLLSEMPVEKVGTLEMRLTCNRMQKEGDLTIGLSVKEDQRRIASLSFSIPKWDGGSKEMFVGGLQGDKGTSEEVVVKITRGLYGLRPKALLVFILQQLAGCWNISRIQAVCDEMHIYKHFQARRHVNASYDNFWVECGGTPGFDGIFDLPVAFVPREISTIRVNKRQMYKRRYAMLTAIADQIFLRMSNNHSPLVKKSRPSPAATLPAPQAMNYLPARAA